MFIILQRNIDHISLSAKRKARRVIRGEMQASRRKRIKIWRFMNFLCPSDPSFSAVKLCNLLTSSGKNCPKLSKRHKFYSSKSHQQWWNFQNQKTNLLKLASSKAGFALNKRWIVVLQLSRCSYSWHSCICLQFLWTSPKTWLFHSSCAVSNVPPLLDLSKAALLPSHKHRSMDDGVKWQKNVKTCQCMQCIQACFW